MFGDAKHVIDFGKSEFGMDTVRWVALMAIHGAVHFPANLGVKYTWVGPGYLSNVYYKMIANKPMYRNDRGGDIIPKETHFGRMFLCNLSNSFNHPKSERRKGDR